MKECPFCGSDKIRICVSKGPDGPDSYFCECETCGATGPIKEDIWDTTDTDKKAVLRWNVRATNQEKERG
ncbi:Lar family restriction alleviation protein [bacterium]|nr:Lar family restriction alleviation protein [bacterium]